MRKNLFIALMIVLVFTMVLSACSGNNNGSSNGSSNNGSTTTPSGNGQDAETPPAEGDEPAAPLSGELTIWTFWVDGIKWLADPFIEMHPDVELNIVEMAWDEMHENLLTTLATGTGAPDIAMIEGSFWHRFNVIEGLEDLLQEPYNAWRYENDFASANWDRWKSLDGSKLLGMPWDLPPQAAFYQPDVLGEYGFPTDPVELGEYMQDTENFLNMAQALRADDIYILEFNNTIMDVYTAGPGYFDENLNFIRNNDRFAEGLDLAKRVKQLDLAFNNSAFWSDEGKQAVASGKIAMVYYATWIINEIKGIGPEMMGKWRMAEMPFGVKAGGGGSTVSITSQSDNKELAWELVEFMMTSDPAQLNFVKEGNMPGYIKAWDYPEFADFEYDLLGNQKGNQILAATMGAMTDTWLATPFNDTAADIWSASIDEAIEKGLDSRAVLQQIEEDIEREISVEKAELKALLGID